MILSIETATNVCSVALHQHSQVVAYTELFIEKSHASALTLLIKDLLQRAATSFEALEAVVASEGPGSYTGLRVGVSVAKGICYAADLPLYAANTLLAMAQPLSQYYPDAYLCPMIDARRMEVYTLVAKPDLEVISDTQALVLQEQSLLEYLAQKQVVVFGNGAKKYAQLVKHEHLHWIEGVYPSAKAIGTLYGMGKARRVDLAYFEPFYLKEYYFAKIKEKV